MEEFAGFFLQKAPPLSCRPYAGYYRKMLVVAAAFSLNTFATIALLSK